MIYSLPYVFLILVFGGLAVYFLQVESDSSKRVIRISCALILLFFFGFRGYAFDDWISYYPAFQKCSYEFITLNVFAYSIQWQFEPGFTFLMCLCKSLTDNYHFFVFICSAINITLLLRFINKRVDNTPLAIILFLCFGGFIMSINLMRNSLAIFIFINAIEYLEQRKPTQYFLLCLLALSFHVSAICYFPLYFFFHKKLNKWIYLALFIVGNMIFLFHVPLFSLLASFILGGGSEGKIQMMIEGYTERYDEMATISIGYLERLLTGILVFCYYDKLVTIRKENIIFINMYICYIMLLLLLSQFNIISQRMSNLFIFSYWILWIDLIKAFSIENNRKLFIAFISIYCVLKTIGSTNFITAEYDNILFGAKSYEERLYIHNRYSKN